MEQPIPEGLQGESWLPFLEDNEERAEENVFIRWTGPNAAGIRGRVPRDMSADTEHSSTARPQVKPKFLDVWHGMADEQEILEAMLDPVRTIVTPNGWKLNYRRSGNHELYNLEYDPYERDNLADKDEYADIIEDLSEKIFHWQRRIRDPVYFH